MIQTLLQVALGGALGASTRFMTNVAAMRRIGPGFPWGTVAVHVVGSFLMGAIVVILAHKDATRMASFLMTGVLGGFSAFSVLSLDALTRWERGQSGIAGAYVAGSVILSLTGIFAGMAATRGLSA